MPQITAAALTSRPLPPLSRIALSFALTVFAWETRAKSRRALRRLDPHMLRDIGLDPAQAADESIKPFWRD
mgnify:CR=1 FL=1